MNLNIFMGYQKNEYFWGIKICEYIYFFFVGGGGGDFRVFFKVNVQNGEYFSSC